MGWKASRNKGMLCHMADSLLELREMSKGSVGTGDKQRKHCGNIFSLLLIFASHLIFQCTENLI